MYHRSCNRQLSVNSVSYSKTTAFGLDLGFSLLPCDLVIIYMQLIVVKRKTGLACP